METKPLPDNPLRRSVTPPTPKRNHSRPKVRSHRVEFRIQVENDTHEEAIRALALLFKEVLRRTPSDIATRLVQAYRDGKDLKVVMAENSKGKNYATSLQWEITEDLRLQQTAGNT